MEGITLKQLLDKKIELQKQITRLVNEFEQATETKIEKIDLKRYNIEFASGIRVYGDFNIEVIVKL